MWTDTLIRRILPSQIDLLGNESQLSGVHSRVIVWRGLGPFLASKRRHSISTPTGRQTGFFTSPLSVHSWPCHHRAIKTHSFSRMRRAKKRVYGVQYRPICRPITSRNSSTLTPSICSEHSFTAPPDLRVPADARERGILRPRRGGFVLYQKESMTIAATGVRVISLGLIGAKPEWTASPSWSREGVESCKFFCLCVRWYWKSVGISKDAAL